MQRTINELKAYILSRCTPSAEGCLEWQGSLTKDGYGHVRFGKITVKVHRVIADAPPHSDVLHSCDNPRCCNVNHLSLGNHQANMIDRSRKCRTVNMYGVQKITEDDVRAIRMSTDTHRAIGIQYGLSRTAITNIKSGARYAWVK